MVLTQGLLPFNLELVDSPELVTSFAAIPLVVETLRAVLDPGRYRALRDALGYHDWKVVRRHLESVIVLVAAGGEHVSDLDRLCADRGLEKRAVHCPAQPRSKTSCTGFTRRPMGGPSRPRMTRRSR